MCAPTECVLIRDAGDARFVGHVSPGELDYLESMRLRSNISCSFMKVDLICNTIHKQM
jgi:hypothetical protein